MLANVCQKIHVFTSLRRKSANIQLHVVGKHLL